ncbi:MAG: UDP-3-O-(3-hydroxymyristoyl)glucosamine N-acyltransferase [Nitrospirae bacterium]|nr:UDP-3-O-(3-hydroxymyristoyl)glucosamine N-acyltransferase [Nitrospirota bacterium]MCL5978878.1 UDP-3-O-(3-hydroxymyristoyl)glucosamine N-acyltransferase [Nitrospirota bacterium]
MKLRDIAALISGEVVGDGEVEIHGVSGISEAKEGDITFLSGTKLLKELKGSRAAAVIVNRPINDIGKPQIIVSNPLYAFARLLAHFYVKPHQYKGINEKAFVSGKAVVKENVTIYPFAHISDNATIGSGTVIYSGVFIGEGSIVGNDSVIHPNVTVREGVKIGSRVIVHAGAVIGSDGFGYVFEDGMHRKIPQVGGVIIEDDVEIGANVTIDRATTGNTIVGKGAKIDNLVQIGHNVRIGNNVILVSQVGIAGSSEIGDGVILGGQVGVADHAKLEAGTMVGAKGGALGEMKRGVYSGILPMPHKDWLRAMAVFAKLPELNKKIKELEERTKKEER